MSARMRLLHVAGPSAGGMRTHLLNLVERLDPTRFEVFVAAPGDALIESCVARCGAGYRRIQVPMDMAVPAHALALVGLARVIRAFEPAICHLHGFKAAALARAALSLPESRVGRLLGKVGGLRESRPAVVYTVHGSVLDRGGPRLAGKACAYLERAFARSTDRVITVSRALWQEYSSIPGLGPDKVRHIPNGVPVDLFACPAAAVDSAKLAARATMGCGAGQVLVGTAVRLAPAKGAGVLLHAAAHLRRWGLAPGILIAGDGPARSELEALSARLGLSDRVRFLGHVTDVAGFYRALDVFVLASLAEGMPISLIEAMASGVPVVASRTPGAEEIVAAGAGRLAAPGDPMALAASIRDAILRRAESLDMAERAKELVRLRYSIQEMVRATEEVYSEALSRRDGSRSRHA